MTPTPITPIRRRNALVALAAALATAAAGVMLVFGTGTAGAATAPLAAAAATTGPAAATTATSEACPTFTSATRSAPPPVTGGTDTEAPSRPGTPVITYCGGQMNVSWPASTDNVGVIGYIVGRIYGDLYMSFFVSTNGWSTSTTYNFEQFSVVAVDAAGNRSATSPTVSKGCPPIQNCTTATATTAGPDTQAPTAPGKPVVTVANGVATVSWAASTDNVGVVTYQVYHQWTDIAEMVTVTAPATSRQFTIGTSDIQHIFSVTAKDAAGNTSTSSGQTSIGTPPTCPYLTQCTSTPPPPGACAISYTVYSQWAGYFQAEIRVRNTGTTTLNGWSLGFSFANGQQITQLWNASYTQTGAAVTAKNLAWNASIPPGGSASFGFIGTWTGSNVKPSAFALNGASCTIE
jgi:hypothetical protein